MKLPHPDTKTSWIVVWAAGLLLAGLVLGLVAVANVLLP